LILPLAPQLRGELKPTFSAPTTLLLSTQIYLDWGDYVIKEFNAQRIGYGTLFRILLIGHLVFPLLLMAVFTVLSAVGLPLFQVGGEYVHGIKAMQYGLLGIVICIPFAFFWSGFFWLGIAPSLWIYSKFKPFKISYKALPD
jgi:hypothetical protein